MCVNAEMLLRLRGDVCIFLCLAKVVNRSDFCKRYALKFLVFRVVMVLFWGHLCCNFAEEILCLEFSE